MIKLKWWKWLCVLLFPYVIIMGLAVPLGPGIIEVHPSVINAGEITEINIVGYNTQFSDNEEINAWIKVDDWHSKAIQIKVRDERNLSLQFLSKGFPDTLSKVTLASLILDTKQGPIVLPSSISLRSKSDSLTTWSDSPIQVRPEASINYPFRNILSETIRNTYFHVPLWFGMVFLFFMSVFYSIRYLRKKNIADDDKVEALVNIGVLYGILGTITGALWGKYAWGSYWSFDVKQNMVAITLLMYGAYFMIRSLIQDPDSKSRISAVYNIFSFCLMIPLIFIIPRRYDSLHPGAGGNPAFGSQDLDNTMRLVFYPAVIAFILLGLWMAELIYRKKQITNKLQYN